MKKMTLGNKVIFATVLMLMLITALCAAVLIKESHNNIQITHHQLKLKSQQQFTLIKNLLTNRLIVWVESFSLQALTTNRSFASLEREFNAHYEMLRLQWQAENIWIFGPSKLESLEAASDSNSYIATLATRTLSQARPIASTLCETSCLQLVSVPILVDGNKIAVVVVATSMEDFVALMNESSEASTSIVGLQEQYRNMPSVEISNATAETSVFRLMSTLNTETKRFVETVLFELNNVSQSTLVLEGDSVSFDDKHFSVFLLPFEQANSEGFYALSIHDRTAQVNQMNRYQKGVFASAILLFVVFTTATHLSFRRLRKRLLNLSTRLPLLAEQQYEAFSSSKLSKHQRHLFGFSDELDDLEEATEELSNQLASLNKQNVRNLEKLEQMAMYDGLTDLPNRNMLNYQIEKQLAQSQRSNKFVALLFVDLDDFKKVNDAFGHEVGDQLLKVAGHRILQTVRDADVVTRFGGDEFVVLITDIDASVQAERVAKKLVSAFAQPILVDANTFHISISIGVSVTQSAQLSSVELLKHADIAMFEAKRMQGSVYRLFDSNMNQRVMRRVDLESAARSAMLDNQFRLALQPIIDLQSRQLIGFEALLRWHHPEKGLIPPGEFIPILENTPFMLQLDYWLIARACRLIQSLEESGFTTLKMCINLSASQFADASLVKYLSEQIGKYDINPQNMQLELTETALVADMASTVSVIEKIRELGCKIAIDDFGTGYASLSYLKNIPADVVKLDQSFIQGMMDNQSDRNIVFATISMVSGIGKVVVAEGIEIPTQYEILCHFGCQLGQGYLISRPFDEDKLWSMLEENTKNNLWLVDLPAFGLNENQIPLL